MNAKVQPLIVSCGLLQVTLIHNVETFGIDPSEFAHAIQKGVACSTAVNPMPGNKAKGMEVFVQGNQVAYVAKLLSGNFLTWLLCLTPSWVLTFVLIVFLQRNIRCQRSISVVWRRLSSLERRDDDLGCLGNDYFFKLIHFVVFFFSWVMSLLHFEFCVILFIVSHDAFPLEIQFSTLQDIKIQCIVLLTRLILVYLVLMDWMFMYFFYVFKIHSCSYENFQILTDEWPGLFFSLTESMKASWCIKSWVLNWIHRSSHESCVSVAIFSSCHSSISQTSLFWLHSSISHLQTVFSGP